MIYRAIDLQVFNLSEIGSCILTVFSAEKHFINSLMSYARTHVYYKSWPGKAVLNTYRNNETENFLIWLKVMF